MFNGWDTIQPPMHSCATAREGGANYPHRHSPQRTQAHRPPALQVDAPRFQPRLQGRHFSTHYYPADTLTNRTNPNPGHEGLHIPSPDYPPDTLTNHTHPRSRLQCWRSLARL